MKKLLLLPLFILSFTVFGQFTKSELYNGINTNIRQKTTSQKRTADMLDSLVVSMNLSSSEAGETIFFFEDEADPVIAGYKVMDNPAQLLSVAYVTQSTIADGQIIEEWVTDVGLPGVTFIPDGVWAIHINAYKTGGTKDTRIYNEIYKRNLAGTETLLGTTATSIALGALEVGRTFNIYITGQALLSTDRIVTKTRIRLTGGGSNPTSVTLGYSGTTAARLSIPSQGGVSGGGSTYTSSNGITLTGSDFTLGGTSSNNTNTFIDAGVNSTFFLGSNVGYTQLGFYAANIPYTITSGLELYNTGRVSLYSNSNYSGNLTGLTLDSTSAILNTNTLERFKVDVSGNVRFPNNTSFTINGNAIGTNTAVVLTDAATIDLTATKHTLATSAATRTFTISYTGDDITIEVTLSNTAATYTFPVGSLCISEGVASGDNTVGLAGVSGDKYIIGVKKIGSVYYVAVKNFGQ